jgi:flavin-dependent dehydrogenase
MSDAFDCEAVVIGGGVAGAAAACHLAQAGQPVVLLEKETAPHHKVCGEFLSAEAVPELHRLGIDITELGAVPIRTVRLVHSNHVAETKLPFQGAALSRFILDERLLRKAQDLGAQIIRGTAVRELESNAAGLWRITYGTTMLGTHAVFLASGKHDLRQFKRMRTAAESDIGFKIHLRLSPIQTEALRDAVEVILFDGGYAGLQLVNRTTANLCLLVRKSAFIRLNKKWPPLLDHLMNSSRHLRERLAGAVPCWDEPLAISSLPFGYLADARQTEPGLYRLGDQFSVIPSFTGSGISIALRSALLATTCFLKHGADGAAAYQRLARDHIGSPVRIASQLTRLSASPRWVQSLAVQVCRAFPSIATMAAEKTRIRESFTS